jgi:hypothetical protein
MKLLVMLNMVMLSLPVLAQVKTETFIIQIQDRSMSVIAPDTRRAIYSVLVENRSLSDQLAKFTVQGKILKYVSVKSGVTEPVEIENKTSANVVFVPVSPAFQEVELIFGKKAYEIPAKK